MENLMTDDVIIRRIDAREAADHAEGLADVLIDCVEGGASVSFMLPITRETAVSFWQGVANGVARGERALLVAQERTDESDGAMPGRIVGTVQIVLAQPENQPHRADIAKMLVHRRGRRRGVAQRLMSAVEDVARSEGKSVLVLDTVTGGDAQRLYERAGWKRVGDVPDYALMPDGALCSTTFYFKHV
jgi:GNAT superfamily N-acetyltransferase